MTELVLTADNPKNWATLELRTRRGHRVVILNILSEPNTLVGGRTVVAMYQTMPGGSEWALNSWYANGKFYPKPEPDQLDLLPCAHGEEARETKT